MWETYRGLFDVFDLHPDAPVGFIIGLGIVMAVMLAYCVYTDFARMLIYDWVTYPGIFASGALSFIIWDQPVAHVLGGIVAGLFFGGLSFVKIRGEYALGFGDVKLYIWLGFVFAQAVLPIMLFASVIGLVMQMVVLSITKGDSEQHFPHGPHIIIASYVVAAICLVVS